MNPENPDAKVIFGEALRLSVPAERQAYVGQARAGHEELRQEQFEQRQTQPHRRLSTSTARAAEFGLRLDVQLRAVGAG